jgi:hypothetical protein
MTTARMGDTCVVSLSGRTFSVGQQDDLDRYLATLGGRRILLVYDQTTPYRCIGGAIFILQRSGVRHRVEMR